MRLGITPFEVDSANEPDLADYYRLRVAVAAADNPEDPPPVYDSVIGRLRTPMTGHGRGRYWMVRQDGRVVGFASVGFPESENRHQGRTEIVVHPDARRRGVGTALLRAVLPALRAEDRTVVEGWVFEGRPGEYWARALALRLVHRNVHQLLVLDGTDPTRWRVDPPAGYRLERWTGHVPEDLLGSFADARATIEDAPTGESSDRPPEWTAELVRESEEDLRRRNVEQRVVAAVHQATGVVAGFTEVEVYAHRPEFGYQGDTAVVPAHRGRGLGVCMKAGMLCWLCEDRPTIERVYTTTADTNTHMIRINQQVGFSAFRSIVEFEDDVADLESRLAHRR